MKSLFRLIVVLLALVGAAAVIGMLLLVRGGISSAPQPGRVETAAARALRSFAIPGDARSLANPVPAGKEAVAAGLAHFADHCATCHANDGGGQTPIGRGLYPRPPDMREAATQNLTDGELFYIIENGVRFTGMPAWGDGTAGTATGSWHLVHFIRHLPRLTRQDLAEMQKLNPKSPAPEAAHTHKH